MTRSEYDRHLEAIRRDLVSFMGAEPPHDDITLLVLQTV